jgi:rhomboid protease GluP
MIVVSLTVGVHVGMLWLTAISPEAGYSLHKLLWNNPHLVIERMWLWQVFTANFVHHGIIHLAMNLFFVLWIGPRLEGLLGSGRFALFYAGAGVFAYSIYDLSAGILPNWGETGGASGCVLALLALYGLCFPTHSVNLYGVLRVRIWWILLLFVISDLSSFGLGDGISWVNNVVHLGGVIFGVVYWYFFGRVATARVVRHR